MKTYYGLLLIMLVLATSAILISPIFYIWKIILMIAVILVAWRELSMFSIQSVSFLNKKVLITEKNCVYEADFQPSSVVSRYLCFLHVQALGGGKRWWIPVSRLEFSKESFRQLKSELQRFSMRSI